MIVDSLEFAQHSHVTTKFGLRFWLARATRTFLLKRWHGTWLVFYQVLVTLAGSLSGVALSTVQNVTSTYALCAGSRW